MLTRRRLPRTTAFSTLRRSTELLTSFKYEQTDPARFYSGLAHDTRTQLENLWLDTTTHSLQDTKILDVGGGPGYFATEFSRAGATYFSLEPNHSELTAAGITVPTSIRADGKNIPFRSDTFDIVYSSNVAEHIDDPWTMGKEMLRVTKPGGLTIMSYTIWLGPFGGHETGLIPHYISGNYARDRYTRTHGHPPKNSFGTSLFAVSCAQGMRWTKQLERNNEAQVIALIPRYHPAWAWPLTRVPVLREFLVSNLMIVLRKPR